MGVQHRVKLTGVTEEQVWSSMIREDAVFKMTENAQPASGDQEGAAGSKRKEN